MKSQFKFGAFLLLSASLFYGFAARAQGIMQTERVSYALTLIDAGDDRTGNTKTGGPVTADTKNVRLKVTVSVPRVNGSNYYSAIPTYAAPARLMFRKHRGPSTAFDGTIPLTRDAPYTNASATASATDKYYPMPQSGADGLSITDATKLNYTAVQSNASKNLDGVDYRNYIGLGQAHDLGRWEATYLSEAFNVAEVENAADDAPANLLMVRSLLTGEATYEWFAASRRGLGSVARISDIQDVGRYMTFTDVRLWTPQGPESDNIDASSRINLGKYENWVSATMPEGWQIIKGSIGVNYAGTAGAQLLNGMGTQTDFSDAPQIISPVYPDGVSQITFSACTTAQDVDAPATLLVQAKTFDDAWTTIQEVTLAASLQQFTISFGDALPEASTARFRLVRNAMNPSGGSANVQTYVIRDLVVRSATPKATFGKLAIAVQGDDTSAEPHAGAPFTISVTAQAVAGKKPRGYKGVFQLRRRANGDTARSWYDVPAEVRSTEHGDGTLTATLTPGTLLTNPDGSLNVTENAFFKDADGTVTGVLPGVYDVAIQCGVLGSFEAGRNEIDGHEAEMQTLDGYDVEEEGANGLPVTVHYPYVVDVRERPAVAESVFMRVMYRTGNSVDNYDIDTFDVPLLPSAKVANTWRVDLAKLLKMAESTAVYAWGYESNDPDNPEVSYDVGYISFKLCAVAKDGTETWYGLNSAITSPETRPTPVEVVPSVAETLKKADSEETAVPILVAVDALPNSHLMVELNLADPDAAVANMAGAFWQDFNTWDPSEVFGETEYRENVTSVTADFDSEIITQDGETKLVGGWKPDEGPLAETTAFMDEVALGRLSQRGQFPFILRDQSYISDTRYFASWGATPSRAEPKFLRVDESDSVYSDYLQFNSNAEVVLRRGIYSHTGNIYRGDAMFRLRGLGTSVSPRHDTAASIKLNGVGKVSFNLGLSIPYDINSIAQIVSTSDDLLSYKGTGLSANVAFTNASQTCAPSGYSVSYYLIDYAIPLSPVLYELRVSQVWEFPITESDRPNEQVVMELYKWANGSPTRQTLRVGNANGADELFHRGFATLANNTYGLWLMADGRIAIGHASGTSSLTTVAVSKDVLISNPANKKFNFALGSAECRPIFRQIDRVVTAGANYSGAPVASDAVTVMTPTYVGGRSIWKVAADTTNSARVQISRLTPTASQAGRVKVTARSANGTKTYDFYTDKMDQLCELTVGAANAELTIEPYDENCNVFIDNISVSSWCGNDENRNGRDNVPLFTDEGFASNTGFMGVGVWIRPEEDDQLNTLPSNYNGRQCLLMQRSRQNNADNHSEVTTEGVTHTGNAMALYLPFSEKGYGPVSFRYRIPQFDEYGKQGELPSVRVMLQYTDDGPYTSFLGTNIPGEAEWRNASAPIELRNTGGEWSMVSITPKVDGVELVDTKGTLRLVMVISRDMEASDDPYVYIDDVRVTTNEAGSSASWTATNVRVAETPISQLYWKDRLATEGAVPEEKTFAQKSTLTRGMQFNSVMTDEETEGSYATTVIESPILDNGAGRVVFAARLTEPQTKPVRLYICATTDPTDAKAGLLPVTYVEVANTVYTTYDIDLSKYQYYYTIPNADGSPSDTHMGDTFSCSMVRRLTIKAFVEGDGVQSDGFGATPAYGRVLIDQLAVSNPVLPSVRVASVAFSNLPGTNSATEFDARSPLSQPVQNASILRAMVRLDRAQLLKNDSIRVFLTVNPHSSQDAASSVKQLVNGYSYTDVLGGTVSASAEHPIYTWNQDNLAAWPLSAWFDSAHAFTQISTKLDNPTKLTAADLNNLGIANTIELTRDASGTLCYYGDLTELAAITNILALPENSLVRYNAWAIYQSEDSDQWFYTQITPSAYTEFPWYFPRNLNAELREKASTETDKKTESFFSPYYWVYSYLPGEAFINEFNFNDNSGSIAKSSTTHFVEICAPVNTNLGGWRVEMTTSNSASAISEGSVSIAPDTAEANKTLMEPDLGAVPYQRKNATSAQRSFYTAFSPESPVYYRDEEGEEQTDLPTTKNGGIAERSIEYWYTLGSGHQASSVRLHRPTGGAEHIVCFSVNGEGNVHTDQSQKNLTRLYETYQSAYAEKGFGGEWEQTFTTGTWDDYINTATPDSFGAADKITAKMHARRLVKADTFIADAAKDNRFALNATGTAYVNDVASSAFANSIATVDMGGVFVTRKNAINENVKHGPLDLTDVTIGTWPVAVNPTLQTRINEPEGGTENSDPVVQVTPRQINPDQYLVLYAGFSSSVVTSELSGRLGTHSLETYDDSGVLLQTSAAGRNTPQTWGLAPNVARTTLTYTALPFHTVDTVTFRVKDASDPSKFVTNVDELEQIVTLTNGECNFAEAAANEGWMTVTIPAGSTAVSITTACENPTNDEERYSVEAKGSFALDPTGGASRDVITQVHPYCGEGSAEYPVPGSAKIQPWWGSNFGFEVAYDDANLADGVVLSSLIVTYPSPTALANSAWDGIKSPWTGWEHSYTLDGATVTAGLEGMEYADAVEFLKTQLVPNAGTRYVEMVGGANGRFADASLISTVGDAYAKAIGYDPTNAATAAKKEPAIPYCVWGVYTVTLNTSHGNEKVSFLMRQAMPGEKAGVWTMPDHYAPMADLNAGKAAEGTIPYFYLYSTPPQSAWVNEVNRVQSTDDADAFVEVVFPVLRDGILSATAPVVEQADAAGWNVRTYDNTGAPSATYDCNAAAVTTSGSTSYNYLTMGMVSDPTTNAMAYVLHRPCGAAEGGVWIATDDNGGTVTPAPDALTENAWLIPATRSFVVAGQSDAATQPGSVQLVGQVVYRDGYPRLSSAIAERTEWIFATATQGSDNAGEMRPDTKPVWNQVTITSTLRNTVYAGTTCGYQLVPGAFDQENLTGETETVTLTQAGRDWVYNDAADGLVVSYRPRANYRFETMTLPAELMGKVILVGRRGSLTAEQILERVTELKRLAVLNESKKLTDWVNLEGRASVEYRTVVNEAGAPVTEEPTGKIVFDTEFFEGEDEKGNITTFGDMDNYVISLVFVEEPSSAQNVIEVAFGQGEVKTGAWMVTQTLYGLDDAGNPDVEKGGEAVTLPIWSDEAGNKLGDHANLHGWLYQPVAGDKIGMTAVINPDLGLQGDKFDPVAEMSATNASLRPFLVWTAIPKTRVPTNLFDPSAPNTALAMTRNDFIKGWGLNTWLGGAPSVQDNATMQLSALRRNLLSGAESTAATALYAKAGIIPMIYQGYCDKNGELSTAADDDNRASESLLSFRTMTEAELADALANGETTGLSNATPEGMDTNPFLPYTSMIDMTDTTFWQDGAILRFAVVIANPVTGYVYDCQSISNFSSEAQEAYCPWYIPDATTNINRATSATEAGGGISPFAWVYNIPQGSVWLNEFRPFSIASESGRVASAFELAMKASPLEADDPANGIFKPTRTLDGWKVVTRYAPMPAYGSDPATPITWQKHKEVPLYSWIPYRRVIKSLADSTGNASLYDTADFTLDFYTATVDPKLDESVDLDATITNMDSYYKAAVYKNADGTVNPDTFQWLNFNLKNADTKSDFDLFDANLQATLTAKDDGDYANGVIYSIVLVRNNGAVEDEVIFYHTSPYAGVAGGADYLLSRLNTAVESETVNNACAGVVRAVTCTELPSTGERARTATAQFLKYSNGQGGELLYWDVAPTTEDFYITLSSPNTLKLGSATLTQPYVEYKTTGLTYERLEAVITGGDGASLELTNNGDTYTGRSVWTYAQIDSTYELTLKDWNTDWYKLAVTRNNEAFTPAGSTTMATTYAVNANTQAATTTRTLVIDRDVVKTSVSYNLVFTYTDDAALLAQAGDLDSIDEGFATWLQQATPAEIAAQSGTDGVTATEKYWLGATTPTDAIDAALGFTEIGTFEENTTEKPYVSVCLSSNGTRITKIVGDGNVVLLGKKALSDAEWIYLKPLEEEDLKEGKIITLTTDCKFFRAVLISDEALEALNQ